MHEHGFVGVRYIGRKARKIDRVAGTGLAWTPDEVLMVAAEKADLLAQFADVWRVEPAAAVAELGREAEDQARGGDLPAAELTLKEITARVPLASLGQIARWHQEEVAGRSRMSVLRVLERALAWVDAGGK